MIVRFVKFLFPPSQWRLPVIIMTGIFVGLVAYIFHVSKASSYLSDDPETCINCHIMAPQYATWNHSSHREVATCNDCHVPHDNVVRKYYFKAMDGMRHATQFTLRNEPQVIQIKEEGAGVVQENCIRCHTGLIHDGKVSQKSTTHFSHRTDRQCWECHRETPHGRVNSLSSVPDAQVPVPQSPVPDWLKKKKENVENK